MFQTKETILKTFYERNLELGSNLGTGNMRINYCHSVMFSSKDCYRAMRAIFRSLAEHGYFERTNLFSKVSMDGILS